MTVCAGTWACIPLWTSFGGAQRQNWRESSKQPWRARSTSGKGGCRKDLPTFQLKGEWHALGRGGISARYGAQHVAALDAVQYEGTLMRL